MKRYQIFLTNTDKNGKMSSFSFSTLQLRIAIGLLALMTLCLGILTVDYSLSVVRQAELKNLRSENQQLNQYLSQMATKIDHFESTLQKIEDFSFKLRSITNRTTHVHSSIGPLPQHYHYLEYAKDVEPAEYRPSVSSLKKKNLFNKVTSLDLKTVLSALEKRSQLLLRDIWSMIGLLEENKHLIAVTPSISPTKGRVTSRFGYRNHPVASFHNGSDVLDHRTHFHKGLDIANAIGTPIVAPANGTVASVGYDKGTGRYIVVDHGYNLKTLYGHLNDVYVKKYQKILRGESIATVGNTGRSTGPHLHYEVRISNQPVDPEYYILDFL